MRGFQSTVLWSVGPPCTSTSSGGRAVPAVPESSGGDQSTPCTVTPSAPGQVTGVGSGRSTASSSPGAPLASTRRSPVGWSTVSCGAVRPPERTHAIPSRPQSRPACHPRDSSRAPPPSSDMLTRRPNPSSLRFTAIAAPSGAHANDRCPGPHEGSACSRASSTNGRAGAPSAGAIHTFIQPRSSETYARVPSTGENRGWPTAIASPPAITDGAS